jgi:SAM-dependent methyltransferase
MNTVLPDNFFDAIIMVSTIEHIGLSAYKQLTLEDDGDFKAISELYRILKPNGVLLMSTPYIGKNPFRVDSFERNYNRDRLNRLVHEFKIEKENYFYPQKIRRHVYWQKVNPRAIDEHFFTFPGIACLILRKSS